LGTFSVDPGWGVGTVKVVVVMVAWAVWVGFPLLRPLEALLVLVAIGLDAEFFYLVLAALLAVWVP